MDDDHSAEALLAQAVRSRRVVTASYTSSGRTGVRVLYPHVLYRSIPGELLLDAFQVDGPTGSGRLPDWRVFKVSGLRDIEVQTAVFLPLPQLDLRAPRYGRRIVVHCLEEEPS